MEQWPINNVLLYAAIGTTIELSKRKRNYTKYIPLIIPLLKRTKSLSLKTVVKEAGLEPATTKTTLLHSSRFVESN